jgi:hypothetical protein
MNGLGIVLCFSGFSAFSYYRHQNNIMGGATPTQSGILPTQKDGIDAENQLPLIASSSSSSSSPPPPSSSSPTGMKNHSKISKTWMRTVLPFVNHNDIHEHGT